MDDETRPDRLGDFLDGILDDEDRRAFEEELAGDPEMAAEAARLEKLTALIEQLPDERDVPAGVNARILDAIAAERAVAEPKAAAPTAAEPGSVVAGPGFGKRLRSIFVLPGAGWAAAAAALLVAALIWYVNRPGADQPDGPGAVQTARLHLGMRVGAPVPDAEYRVYEADMDRIFQAFRLSDHRAAISYNNLRVPVDQPYHRVRSNRRGEIAFGDSMPSGMRIVSVEVPGCIRQWGLLDCGSGGLPTAGASGRLPPSRLFPADRQVVRGQVTDATSGQPAEGAMVTTEDGSGVLVTNRQGHFEGMLSFVLEGELRLFVCARGYATGILPIDREALARAAKSAEVRFLVKLEPALRYDVGFVVVGEDGQPLPGAVVLATAEEKNTPDHRAGRPEIAIADKDGKIRLWQLRECRYQLEVHHRNADFAPINLDVTNPPERITARPAGGGELAMRVAAADGTMLRTGQVMLSHANEVQGQMRWAAMGSDDGARFQHLEPGVTTARVFTGDGVAYVLEFEVAPDAALAVPYRLPATPNVVSGRLASALARKFVALRLEADLEPVTVGGRQSTVHRVVVEVGVDPDGSFRFPPLPRCRLMKLEGYPAGNPWQRTPLGAPPGLAEGLASATKDEIEITVPR